MNERSETAQRPTDPKDAESAFPIVHSNGVDSWTQQCGLTKREYFAAMAMQGMLARTTHPYPDVAEFAVKNADSLLKELAK